VFREETEEKNTLNRTLASKCRILSALNLHEFNSDLLLVFPNTFSECLLAIIKP